MPIVLALLALWLSACADPCTQLSEAICDCKPNQPEQALCIEQLRISRAAKVEGVLDEEAAVCDALVDSCTCEALEKGDLAACGLAP